MKIVHTSLSLRQKRIIVFSGLALFLVLCAVVCIYIGRPMIKFIDDREKFQQWIDNSGFWGKIGFVGMVIFQVIIAIIPGEPLELAAGYAFGAIEGTVLCVIGTLIGSIAVFSFVRKFGMRAVTLFFSEEKIKKLRFLHKSKYRNFWVFIIFFITGTPKDLLAYFVGLTDMRLSTWIAITAVARLPSIVTSTVAANAVIERKYVFALIVFGVTFIISLIGMVVYRLIVNLHQKHK